MDMRKKRKRPKPPAVGIRAESEGFTGGEAELNKDVLQIARYLLRKMNLPLDMADDLGQTGILKYLQVNTEERKQIRNRRAYLYRMMKNELLNQIRKEKPHVVSSFESGATDHAKPEAGLINNSSDIELGVLIRQVWNQLGPDDRRLFELLTFGYGGRELAFRLGVSSDAARQRVSRLKARLKVILFSKEPSSRQS